MNKYRSAIFTVLLIGLMCSCSNKHTYSQEELYAMVSSGVVLVKTEYTQQITLDMDGNKQTFIFKQDDDGNIRFYESVETVESEELINTSFGTGFFISNSGIIVTNSHVVTPQIESSEMIYNLLLQYIKSEIIKLTQILEDEEELLSSGLIIYQNNPTQNMLDGINRCNKNIELLQWSIDRYKTCLRCEKYKTYTKVSGIDIAYNNSNINDSSSWNYCSVLVDNPSYDLAVIQMYTCSRNEFNAKVKATQEEANNSSENGWFYDWSWAEGRVRYDLKVEENKNGHQIVPSDKYIFQFSDISATSEEVKLYMIGFNQGPILANTATGIKAQITQGNISQNTDDIKIMYSIPALQGSSGSPVLNQYGELVAINFAGLSTTQGFNYGIKVDKLQEIITSDANIKELMIDYSQSAIK